MSEIGPVTAPHDFGRTYWRSAPIAIEPLPTIEAATIDDTTFRLLADNIPTLCWVANGDGYIFWYNRRWHEYCGTTPERMEGWGWTAVHDPELLPSVLERWTQAIATAQPFEMTFPLRGADGVLRPFLTRVQPMLDESGAAVRWFGVNSEISDQVAAEEALRAERDRSRHVLESMKEGFVLLDRDFRVLDINAEGLKLEQRSREAIIGRSHWEVWPGTEHSELGQLYKRVMNERGPLDLEHRYTWPDGHESWIDVRGYPTADGLALFYRDITERKRAETALRESEELNRRILQSSADCIKVLDLEGRLEFISEGGLCLMEIDDFGAIQGSFWPDLWSGEEHAKALAAIKEAKRGGIGRFEGFATTMRGSPRWWDVVVSPINGADGQPERLLSVSRDVTAAKTADAALRESETRLRAIVSTAPVGIIMADASGAIYDGNVRAEEILGHPIIHSPGTESYGDWVSFHADGRKVDGHEYPLARALAGEERPVMESRYQRGDGRLAWIRVVGSPMRDENGALAGAIVAILDIDQERRAQEALRRLNAELEARIEAATADLDRVWRNARDIFVVIDEQGVFKRINPATTATLGWSADEMIGRPVFDFVLPEDTAVTRSALEQARSDVLPAVENRYRTKDGHHRTISWVAAPEGGLIYAYGRDITAEQEQAEALRQVEQALRQAQKMDAVGQLTGGIAHDFNNMLAVVIGSLDLLGRRLGTADLRVRHYVEAATDAARRAALLTHRLLAFSRQQPLQPEPVDANRLVAGMSDLLRHSLGANIRLETVLAGGLWRTHADPNQLENVILNLGINARDAMPEGGRLTIETQNASLDARYVAAEIGVVAGQYVLVAVTDTGCGMPAHVVAKAFDPFFTTKEVGKGTGLGLSQVYGFVKQSGGHVRIYSEPGQGTTVKVYLPRLAGTVVETERNDSAVGLLFSGFQETVLVVEDEPAVRQFSVDALSELGYRVLEADGAAAALRMLDAYAEIVLLFTDIVMPDINGAKLAEEARRRRPDLKVLFTTGYTRNAVVHNGVLDPGVQLIGKPFTIEELAAKLRAVLDDIGDG